MAERDYFIGIDIGGTFTDLVIAHRGGEPRNVKTLTTHHDPVAGVMAAIHDALQLTGITLERVDRIVHATTLPTNAVLERKGAKVGFITTLGFGDMFVLSKHKPIGADRYDVHYQRPAPLVPRTMTAEIQERMDHHGCVVMPLDSVQAEAAIRRLADSKPEAVAVCLLHAYANPAHEQAVGRLVRKLLPGCHVALSSEIWPEYGEYERASTTVLSAYIGPTLGVYLAALEARLRALGFARPLQIMQSNGGVMTAEMAVKKAAYIIESGPAAGIVAAAYLGRQCGYDNLIAFDMGGTTAKAGLVRAGKPQITHDFRVGGNASAGSHGGGEPVKVPVIDLAEVGAGGGSIARIDKGGFLRVGPDSAGSAPGPACYGFGGTDATVTDANVLLGYLDPDYFLGGKMKISRERSLMAIDALAQRLGVSALHVAKGIHTIANTHMSAAIRIVTLQRGVDPREQMIVASGGAGPIHVVRVAESFDIPTVIIPPSPGVRSAFGLLVADLAYDKLATAAAVNNGDTSALDAQFTALEEESRAALAAQGIAPKDIIVERAIGIRFVSQALSLMVTLPDGPITAAVIADAEMKFRDQYFAAAGLKPAEACALVNSKVQALCHMPKPSSPKAAAVPGGTERALKKHRAAFFEEHDGFVDTPVYDRARLIPGDTFAGPAIIEEPESTVICPPGYIVEVDRHLNIVIERAGLSETPYRQGSLAACR